MLSVIVFFSLLLALIPLAGIAWMVVTGTLTTVDGLFGSLILLSLSAIFFLNVFWELRDRQLRTTESAGKAGPKPPTSEES